MAAAGRSRLHEPDELRAYGFDDVAEECDMIMHRSNFARDVAATPPRW